MTQTKNVTLTGVLIGWTAPMDNKPGRLFLDSDDGPEVVLNIWPESTALLAPLGDMANAEGTRIEATARYVETRGTEVRYRPSAIKVLAPAPEGASPTEPTKPAPRAPRAASSVEDGMAKGNATTATAVGLFQPWISKHGVLPPDEVCLEYARKVSLTAAAILNERQTETTPQQQAEPQQDEPPAASVERL